MQTRSSLVLSGLCMALVVSACGNLLGVDFDEARLVESGPEHGGDASLAGSSGSPDEAGSTAQPGASSGTSSNGDAPVVDPDCVSPPEAEVCEGHCGAVRDVCNRMHDCETLCGNARCYETVCCQPRGCEGACNRTLDDGCGGTVECGAPTPPAVCADGNACTPKTQAEACGNACDVLVEDGCGGHITCNTASGAVCYQGANCYPRGCNGGSCGLVQQGCGLGGMNCGCGAGLCCSGTQCVPRTGGGGNTCLEVIDPIEP